MSAGQNIGGPVTVASSHLTGNSINTANFKDECRAIPACLSDLNAVVTSVEHNIDQLCGRLGPILLGVPPTPPSNATPRPSANTQIGEVLMGLHIRLQSINTQLSDLEKRAQL